MELPRLGLFPITWKNDIQGQNSQCLTLLTGYDKSDGYVGVTCHREKSMETD